MNIINAINLAVAVYAAPTGTISNVETSSRFAGKLGYRVETTLTVDFGQGAQKVRVSPYHTRIAGAKKFEVGQKIKVRRDAANLVSLADVILIR